MTSVDLYELDLGDARFSPPLACGGNPPDASETCVTLAPIPGVAGAYALGDSKRPGAEPLRFTGAELRRAGIDPARFRPSA